MFRMRFQHCLPLALSLSLLLSACYHPPYNHYRPYNPLYSKAAQGAAAGAVVGAVVGSNLASAGVGAGIGALLFSGNALRKESKTHIIYELQKRGDIQYIHYGDTMTLIVPTDRYFLTNSPHLFDLCYRSLMNIVKLLKYYPCRTIYVAGFSDSVGSRYHKNMLTQARAETIVTFLWANGIPAKFLHPEGYGDKHDVSENKLTHGAAQNRRIEIQWFNHCDIVEDSPMPTK